MMPTIRRQVRRIVTLVVAGVLLAGMTLFGITSPVRKAERGADLPVFHLPTVRDADTLVDESVLGGAPAILNFWASWCLGCRVEHDFLLRLAYRGFPIYGLNHLDNREDAMRWLDFYGNPFRFSIFDARGTVGSQLGIEALPVSLLLDKEGKVIYRHVGPLDEQSFADHFLPLLQAGGG